MKSKVEMGENMLERQDSHATATDAGSESLALVPMSHRDVIHAIGQLSLRIARELLDSPEVLAIADMEGAPVRIDPRRFCHVMAPYLCMN